MLLQGIPMDDEPYRSALCRIPEGTLHLLAGNAVNFFNMSLGILAAFSALDHATWTQVPRV